MKLVVNMVMTSMLASFSEGLALAHRADLRSLNFTTPTLDAADPGLEGIGKPGNRN
jgi:hypothetical protein